MNDGDSASSRCDVDAEANNVALYFDGTSSRRRVVTVVLTDKVEIREGQGLSATWLYADIRRVDGPARVLRTSCVTAPMLARLEIRDENVARDLLSRCPQLDENSIGNHGVATIVGWSLAAVVSIVGIILFGLPLAADRLTPLIPQAVERRLGNSVASQVKTIFGGEVCNNEQGQAAFVKLVNAIRGSAGLDTSVDTAVLVSIIPNAFALPGGKVYIFSGLLEKAENADEIAGVLAHELGHLKHRDGMRNMIYNGGVSFLAGMLFGDITGSGALIFASRSLLSASYSRDAEQSADTFSIDIMHRLGRPTKPMGELLFRVTGNEGDKSISILASHPLTEDRLARMNKEDRPPSGPPLLTPGEWTSLKTICNSKG
jgi:Zn-dependent protease with chaperone function